uniref:Accessory gland protein n=1 Tax=Schistocephalus solidus TaxID=70667 RepID=A0A183T6R3_SCHSO
LYSAKESVKGSLIDRPPSARSLDQRLQLAAQRATAPTGPIPNTRHRIHRPSSPGAWTVANTSLLYKNTEWADFAPEEFPLGSSRANRGGSSSQPVLNWQPPAVDLDGPAPEPRTVLEFDNSHGPGGAPHARLPQWCRGVEAERAAAAEVEEAQEREENVYEEGDTNVVAMKEEGRHEGSMEALRRRRAQAELERHYRRLEQPAVPQIYGKPYPANTFLPLPCMTPGVPVHKASVKLTDERPLLPPTLPPTPEATTIPGVNQWRRDKPKGSENAYMAAGGFAERDGSYAYANAYANLGRNGGTHVGLWRHNRAQTASENPSGLQHHRHTANLWQDPTLSPPLCQQRASQLPNGGLVMGPSRALYPNARVSDAISYVGYPSLSQPTALHPYKVTGTWYNKAPLKRTPGPPSTPSLGSMPPIFMTPNTYKASKKILYPPV